MTYISIRAFPSERSRPLIALDYGILEGLAKLLRDLQADPTGSGLKLPLTANGAAWPVGLGIDHSTQRFLYRAPRHHGDVIRDPSLVDLDHLPHRFRPLVLVLVQGQFHSSKVKEAAVAGRVRYTAEMLAHPEPKS